MNNITVNKLQSIQQKVEHCLDKYPETRNSDIDLYARLCENFYPPFERPIYNWRDLAYAMHSVVSLDHVARCRRKVIRKYNYTRYLPTDRGIALHRGYNEQVWRDYAVANNIDLGSVASNIPEGYNSDGEMVGFTS